MNRALLKELNKIQGVEDDLKHPHKLKALQNINKLDKATPEVRKRLNNNHLDSCYFGALKLLSEHHRETIEICEGNKDSIYVYDLLVELHLAKVSRKITTVTYKISNLGKMLLKYIKHNQSFLSRFRGIIDGTLFVSGIILAFYLPLGVFLPNIVLMILGGMFAVCIMSIGEIRGLKYLGSRKQILTEKNVLGFLKSYLDNHDYQITKFIFREHEED